MRGRRKRSGRYRTSDIRLGLRAPQRAEKIHRANNRDAFVFFEPEQVFVPRHDDSRFPRHGAREDMVVVGVIGDHLRNGFRLHDVGFSKHPPLDDFSRFHRNPEFLSQFFHEFADIDGDNHLDLP